MKISRILHRSFRKYLSNEEIKNTYYVKMQSRKSSSEDGKGPSDLFYLPPPIITVIQYTEDVFSSQFVTRYKTIILKLLEWTFFYLLCYFGFGFGWVVFFISLYYVRFMEQTDVSQRAVTIETEKDSLAHLNSHTTCAALKLIFRIFIVYDEYLH